MDLIIIKGGMEATSLSWYLLKVYIVLFSGIILVHDLTNRKSQINLQKWLSEILDQDGSGPSLQHVEVDPEQFLGTTQVKKLFQKCLA